MGRHPRTKQTRDRLVAATLDIIRTEGLNQVSARVVAAEADVNQALIFYHFGSVSALVVQAYEVSVATAVASYEAALAPAGTVGEVLDIVHARLAAEESRGDEMMMAQLMAQSQHDDALAEAARSALAAWHALAREVLKRVLADSVAGQVIDREGAAHLVVTMMLGGALVSGLNPASLDAAGATLRDLDRMARALDRLPGPARHAAIVALTRAAR